MVDIYNELEKTIKNDVAGEEERAFEDLVLSIKQYRKMGILSLSQIDGVLRRALGDDYQFLYEKGK